MKLSSHSQKTPHRQSYASMFRLARKLLSLLQPYRRQMQCAALGASLASLLLLVPYGIVAWVITQCIESQGLDARALLLATCGMIIAVLAEKSAFGLATFHAHQAAFATQRDLRLQLAAQLEKVHMGYCEFQSEGALRTLFIDDIETLEDGMAHLLTEIAMIYIDWRLALLALLPIFLGLYQLAKMLVRGRGATFEYLAWNVERPSRRPHRSIYRRPRDGDCVRSIRSVHCSAPRYLPAHEFIFQPLVAQRRYPGCSSSGAAEQPAAAHSACRQLASVGELVLVASLDFLRGDELRVWRYVRSCTRLESPFTAAGATARASG